MPETEVKAAEATQAAASDMVQLLPGVELPSQIAQIVCWTLLVLAILGLLMLVFLPFILCGIKKAIRQINDTTQGLEESIQKVAEWTEYTGSQTETAVQHLERATKTVEDHAAAGRKRTQAQAAQAVQLGKLMQQQIEATKFSFAVGETTLNLVHMTLILKLADQIRHLHRVASDLGQSAYIQIIGLAGNPLIFLP